MRLACFNFQQKRQTNQDGSLIHGRERKKRASVTKITPALVTKDRKNCGYSVVVVSN